MRLGKQLYLHPKYRTDKNETIGVKDRRKGNHH